VGFAVEDLAALKYIRGLVEPNGSVAMLDLLADPDDPRDLYGMLNRARR
jgi:ornithine cyclodeaminase